MTVCSMMAENSSKPETDSEYPKLILNELKIKFVNQSADTKYTKYQWLKRLCKIS